ncbi:threonine ammonia-lyase [uncultured Albimonas sp.]|uniref:threonine ammonia-lyase n=1 Tax=uncultured Albimonas sp. TaxID=1331701 RepID=UPI0030EF773A|tara:strand:- start:2363 stop:3571 length:1209 start_codon:yes stop_codon:yes gene_type:complete
MTLSYADVARARSAIADATLLTPTVPATRLSLQLGFELYLKLENLQHTNAFKARGALAKLLSLSAEERATGVIACSAGNHAQGVAYHATRLGVRSVIVMPHGTPFNKIKRTQDFGARVELHGANFEEAMAHTHELIARDGLVLIHPFDDPIVAAGQGTVACEMLEQVPDLDAIVAPIGGGGLIAGMSVAAKALKPSIEVIGAQALLFDAVKARIEGSATHFGAASLAEGIAVKAPSEANVAVIRENVDRIESVTEEEIETAVFDLLSNEKLVVEGAAGAGMAVVTKLAPELQGRKIGLVICGGNIDSRILSSLILRGLVRDGRIARLTFEIDDRPGQLAEISRVIGEAGANVIEVIHQRMFQSVALKQAELDVVLEARDRFHVREIVDDLRGRGFQLRAEGD